MKHLQAFRRDEDGAIVAYTLFMLLIMLAAGGIAIDVMRQEMQRSRLQHTLDTAVLAAAGAPWGADAKAIVENYFSANDMSSYLHEIDEETDIIKTLNASKVSARASMTMDTYLMQLSGIKTLSAHTASTAEMRVPKLEVALVLDVSGSMGSNSKLTNLKVAAKQFVTKILSTAESGDAVISVVPFSWNVAAGEGIYSALQINETQNYSTCLRFTPADYESAKIDPAVKQDQQIYTSLYGNFDSLQSNYRSCYTEDYSEILPYSMDEAALHAKIDSLVASGNTSGHLGMKWGAALLDPAFQTVATSLIADELIDAGLTTIPAKYNEGETLKVIVMMGDGQNTTSYFFNDDGTRDPETGAMNGNYRGANSDLHEVISQQMEFKYAYHVYKHTIRYDQSRCSKNNWECIYEASGPAESAYYLRKPSNNTYYSIEEGKWLSQSEFNDLSTKEGFVSSTQLSWEQAWGRMSPRYYGDITGSWGPWNDYANQGRDNGSDKDIKMRDICTATKNKGVVVYSIGFEISRGGTAETELKSCASSVAHYYRAEGVNINDAFNSIASNVVNLRLTQ